MAPGGETRPAAQGAQEAAEVAEGYAEMVLAGQGEGKEDAAPQKKPAGQGKQEAGEVAPGT